MVYKKRVYRRKYVRKPRSTSAGTVALKMVKQVRRATRPEVKFKDHEFSRSATSTTMADGLHQGIPQGVRDGERVGDFISPSYLRGSIVVRCAERTVSTVDIYEPSLIRIVFFRGKQENGFFPSVSDLFETSASDQIQYQYNWYNRSHYTILSDRTYALSPGQFPYKLIKVSLKLTGNVKYERQSPSITENGGIYCIVIGQSNEGGVYPDYDSNLRLTYTDS